VLSPSEPAAAAAAALDPGEELEEGDDGLGVQEFTAEPGEAAERRSRWRRLPWVRQHDEMDCAAACMSMVARYHGRRIGLPAFRSLIHVTRDGASMLALQAAAERVGMRAMGVACELEGLEDVRPPLIALMRYHYVVVYRLTGTHVTVGDPARGVAKVPREEFECDWSGFALLLAPAGSFRSYPESEASYRKYWGLLRDHRRELLEIGLASALVALFGLVAPLFMQLMFDHVFGGGKAAVLHLAALAVILLQLFTGGLDWVRNYLLVQLGARLDSKLSALFLRHTLHLPLSFFALRRVGDITTRMAEIERVRDFFTGRSINLALRAGTALLYCAVLGLYHPALLGLLALLLPPLVLLVAVAIPSFRRRMRRLQQAISRNQGATFEQLRAVDTLRSLNAGTAARWRWESTLLDALELKRGAEQANMLVAGAAELLRGLIGVAMLMLAVWLHLRRELSVGQVVAVTALLGQIVQPLAGLIVEWSSVGQVTASLGRIDDVVTAAAEPPRPALAPGAPALLRGGVELRDVTFRYGNEQAPVVLEGVSLRIEPGQTVALVGPSGSGKSTLGYLVGQLYRPTEGQVLLDGVDAAELPLEVLRRQVGMVLQESVLFTGTILENIALGDPHPSFERVLAAAMAADAHGFITRLPGGYATGLTEGAANLSGGQRQRLAIARALYRDPPILVLDEATASLDALSEKAIARSVEARAGKKTTLIIAHRPGAVRHADRIVVLRGGRIVEERAQERRQP